MRLHQLAASGLPLSLLDALCMTDAEMVPRWMARQLLQRLAAHNLEAWNNDPYRVVGDVLGVLDHAIRLCGGTPPREGVSSGERRRRGGWAVAR